MRFEIVARRAARDEFVRTGDVEIECN